MTRKLLWTCLVLTLIVSLYRTLSAPPDQSFTIEGPGNCREVVFALKELPYSINFRKLGDRDFAVLIEETLRIDLNQNPPRVQKHKMTDREWESSADEAHSRQGHPGSPSQIPFIDNVPDSQDEISIRGQSLKKSGQRWAGSIGGKAPGGENLFLTSYDGRPRWDRLRWETAVGTLFDYSYPTGVRYYFDVYSLEKGKLFTVTGNTGAEDSDHFAQGWYWLDEKTFAIRFLLRKSLLFCEVE